MTTTEGNATSHGVNPTPEITAADKGGANAPAQQTAPNAAPGVQPQPGQQQQTPLGGADAARPDLYNPNKIIPDHLLGQDDKGTIDKLHAAYKGARDELAKGKPAPVKAADYKFEWSDKVKGAGIGTDDPALKGFADIAEKHNFSQEQIAAIPAFFDMAVDKGWIEKPFDSAGLLTELAPADFKGSPEEKQAKGGERLLVAENWIKQLDPKSHGFTEPMKQELRLLTTSLAGVQVVEHFMRSGMNTSVSPGGGGNNPPAVTKADLDARVADPRNKFDNPKFDEGYATETQNMFKRFYQGT